MGFRIKFVFIAWAGFFLACTAWACDPGYYLACGEDPYDNSCTECDCQMCDIGQTSDGTGVLYYCPNTYPTYPYGDSGCYDAGYCADYDDCPPGAPAGRKCKQVEDCDGIAGCTRYELCNIATGAVAGYFVPESNVCHMESGACYENEVDCSVFDISVFWGEWTCAKADQSGRATWDFTADAWDTSRCTCSVINKNIDAGVMSSDVTKCKKANAKYVVATANQFSTKKLTDSVYYTTERQYCLQCYPGYLPYIETSPLDGLIIAPAGVTSSYGVRRCPFQVSAPYYASCQINYPLNNPGSHMCREECPQNMETLENGATSIDDCVPMGVTYEDSTGSFRLGPDSNLCN